MKRKLQRVNTELFDYGRCIENERTTVAGKMNQNKTFIKLLYRLELEGKT